MQMVEKYRGRDLTTEKITPVPLYVAAQNGSIKDMVFQESDAETATFMFDAKNPPLITAQELFPRDEQHKTTFRKIPFTDIHSYIAEPEWFAKEGHDKSIHGIRHLLRVTTYVNIMAQTEGLDANEKRMVSTAAGIHDLGRVDDRTDREHGKRSGELFQNDLTEDLSERGLHFTLPEIDVIKDLATYHEWAYQDIPDEVKHGPNSKLLDILMAADALDRFRLPKQKWWPKEDFLRVESAKRLLPLAAYMTLATEKDYFVEGKDFVHSLRDRGEEVGVFQPSRPLQVTEPLKKKI